MAFQKIHEGQTGFRYVKFQAKGQHYKKGKKVENHQSYALTINQLSVLLKKKERKDIAGRETAQTLAMLQVEIKA